MKEKSRSYLTPQTKGIGLNLEQVYQPGCVHNAKEIEISKTCEVMMTLLTGWRQG